MLGWLGWLGTWGGLRPQVNFESKTSQEQEQQGRWPSYKYAASTDKNSKLLMSELCKHLCPTKSSTLQVVGSSNLNVCSNMGDTIVRKDHVSLLLIEWDAKAPNLTCFFVNDSTTYVRLREEKNLLDLLFRE